MLARLERPYDEDGRVHEGRDDRRIGHGYQRRAVDDHAVETLAKLLDEFPKSSGGQHVPRIGGSWSRGDRPQVIDHRGLRDLVQLRFAYQHVRNASVTSASKDVVKAR